MKKKSTKKKSPPVEIDLKEYWGALALRSETEGEEEGIMIPDSECPGAFYIQPFRLKGHPDYPLFECKKSYLQEVPLEVLQLFCETAIGDYHPQGATQTQKDLINLILQWQIKVMDSLCVASSWHELIKIHDDACATDRRRSFEEDRIELLEKTGCIDPIDYERKVSSFVQTNAGISAVIDIKTKYSLDGYVQTRTWRVGKSVAGYNGWQAWIKPQPVVTDAQTFQEMLLSPEAFPRWTYRDVEIDSARYEAIKLLHVAAFCAARLLNSTHMLKGIHQLYFSVCPYDRSVEERVDLKLEDGSDYPTLLIEMSYRTHPRVDVFLDIEISTSLAPAFAWAVFKLIRNRTYQDNPNYFDAPEGRYWSQEVKTAKRLDQWLVRAEEVVSPAAVHALVSELEPHSSWSLLKTITEYLQRQDVRSLP